MAIEFFLPVHVQPKQADKSRVVFASEKCPACGRGRKHFIHHYQSKAVQQNADALVKQVLCEIGHKKLSGPVRVEFTFEYPWRSSEPMKNRHEPKPKDTKPDWDNLSKQVCDILEKVGTVKNDSQISEAVVKKVWSGRYGLTVKMEEIEP